MLQMVWLGVPDILVCCYTLTVQVLLLEERKRPMALHHLSAQLVGYLPFELGKHPDCWKMV